jgi:hypothetical protein
MLTPFVISDADSNMTRFVVLARGNQPPVGEGPWMTSLIFEFLDGPVEGRFTRPPNHVAIELRRGEAAAALIAFQLASSC